MAGRIPESAVEDVLNRASIVDIVGEYVRLTRKGGRFLGLCPFHEEKTPSFSVSPDRNLFYCFGCGVGGNVATFLMRHDALSFPEAVRKLAARYQIELPEESGAGPRVSRGERESYFAATEFAAKFFEAELWSDRGRRGREYLDERGIDESTARAFSLGLAPDDWSRLIDAAGRRGISPKELEAAGLALERRSGGGYYDRFRARVMFPIRQLSGRTIAFSGRTLDPEERAKYINSPETAFYTKGKEIFGLRTARRAIRDEGYAVLVEGNFDVVSLHQAGLENVSAALGTALTSDQAHILRRLTERTVLLFDGDEAGARAAEKALAVLLEAGLVDVRWCRLNEGEDPDDIVRRGGGDLLRERIEAAPPMLDALLDELATDAARNPTPLNKRRVLERAAELLNSVRDRFLWNEYADRLARRLDTDPGRLARYLRRGTGRSRMRSSDVGDASDVPDRPRVASLDQHQSLLVETLCDRPELLGTVHREELHRLVDHEPLARFLEQVAREFEEDGGPGMRAAIERLDAEDPLAGVLIAALARGRRYTDEQVLACFDDAVAQLKRGWCARHDRVLEARIREAEDAGDFDRLEALITQRRQLQDVRVELDARSSRA